MVCGSGLLVIISDVENSLPPLGDTKVSLFFVALFPGFIFHDNLDPERQFLILGLIFWLQANMIFIGVSIFSNKINNIISDDNFLIRVSYVIEICVYIFIAIWILK